MGASRTGGSSRLSLPGFLASIEQAAEVLAVGRGELGEPCFPRSAGKSHNTHLPRTLFLKRDLSIKIVKICVLMFGWPPSFPPAIRHCRPPTVPRPRRRL